MRPLVVFIMILSFLGLAGAGLNQSFAADGKAVFDSLHCGICHRPNKGAAGVTLPQIAQAYKDQKQLVQYFAGESEAVVEPTKSAIMWGQLKKIQALSEEDQKALADYLLSFK